MSCDNCNQNKCCCVKTVSTRGPRGPKGDRGATGPAGPPGTGSNGTNGTNGTNGVDGANGTSIHSTYNSATGTISSTLAGASTTLKSIVVNANTLASDGDELEINYYGKYDNTVGNGIESELKLLHSTTPTILATRNGVNYSPSDLGVFSIKLIITRISATVAFITAEYIVTNAGTGSGGFTGLDNRYMSLAEVSAVFNFAASNTIDFVVTNDAGVGTKMSYTLHKATSELKLI